MQNNESPKCLFYNTSFTSSRTYKYKYCIGAKPVVLSDKVSYKGLAAYDEGFCSWTYSLHFCRYQLCYGGTTKTYL